jgi:hypothetical protein
MNEDEMIMPPPEDDDRLTGRLWTLRRMFRRAHEQLDVAIDMLDDGCESDPAPSVPPQ